MNSDNKFGQCCGCPALMNQSRDLTLWSSSRNYNNAMMKKMGKTNSNDFRTALQNNAESMIKKTFDEFDSSNKCKNSSNNIFYIDSSNFNNLYDNLNAKQSSTPYVENANEKLSGLSTNLVTDSIMNLSSLSLTPLNPKR